MLIIFSILILGKRITQWFLRTMFLVVLGEIIDTLITYNFMKSGLFSTGFSSSSELYNGIQCYSNVCMRWYEAVAWNPLNYFGCSLILSYCEGCAIRRIVSVDSPSQGTSHEIPVVNSKLANYSQDDGLGSLILTTICSHIINVKRLLKYSWIYCRRF